MLTQIPSAKLTNAPPFLAEADGRYQMVRRRFDWSPTNVTKTKTRGSAVQLPMGETHANENAYHPGPTSFDSNN